MTTISVAAGKEKAGRLAQGRHYRRIALYAAPAVVLVAAMVLDTRVVRIGAPDVATVEAFNPDIFGKTTFPKVKAAVIQRAVDASTLAQAIADDKDAAVRQYGVGGGIGPQMSVKFTGTLGEYKHNMYKVDVPGLPENTHIRLQVGPAISGSSLRDATGMITFGQFRNQIEYQNAGAALNRAMKAEVFSGMDPKGLGGKTVKVTGVFQLINPANWIVTPVEVKVQ